jgi:hypothetical protein
MISEKELLEMKSKLLADVVATSYERDDSLDYIRLGLAAKTAWSEIDFEKVEIYEVPFDKDRFDVPIVHDFPDKAFNKLFNTVGPTSYWPEEVNMRRWRIGETEFTMGCTSSFDKLLIGIKEVEGRQ